MKYEVIDREIDAVRFTRANQEEVKTLLATTNATIDISIPRCIDGMMDGIIKKGDDTFMITEDVWVAVDSSGEIMLFDDWHFTTTYKVK